MMDGFLLAATARSLWGLAKLVISSRSQMNSVAKRPSVLSSSCRDFSRKKRSFSGMTAPGHEQEISAKNGTSDLPW